MQTVRKYAYLVVIGLVAALVFSNSLSNIIFQTAGSVLQSVSAYDNEHSSVGGYLLSLIAILTIVAVIRHALVGIPKKFRGRVQLIRRRLVILLLISAFGMMFLLS